ncbi:hypothetical protein BCR44DRAFT_1186566 [Catenaria anguillulae PL171]|uniref:Uncharacterized protein n=1 Tax=Catenaria anguillulae PL171 TaxID=765915 RepID=A0A1Y2HJB5_9FUNG|nr:hypothetical protein BCR44DRAFT_1186566 [Catenaria anguillulae PL171]
MDCFCTERMALQPLPSFARHRPAVCRCVWMCRRSSRDSGQHIHHIVCAMGNHSIVFVPSSPLTQLKLIQHPCRPAQAFALVSPISSSNPAFLTTDTWSTSTAYPLANALCGNSCPNGFTVYDVQFTSFETLLFATSNGLYQSTSSFRSARRLTTGVAALDSPTSTVQFANRGCFSELLIAMTSTRIYWSVIGSSNAWTESSALPPGSTLVASISWESDLPGQAPRIIVATASNVLQVLDATNATILSSSFPSGVVYTSGTPAFTLPHIDGREILLLLGNTALVSDDAGQSWRVAFRSPGAGNPITHATTARTRNAIAALTSLGNIMVGRSGTVGAVQVPGLARFNGANAPPAALTYDPAGILYVVYAASQDGSTVSLVRSRVGSVEASVGTPVVGGPAAALPWPANVAIASVPTGVNSWQLVAVNAATGAVVPGTWQETDVGMSIAHASRPSVAMIVVRVTDDGSAALVQALGSIATLSSLSAMGSAMDVVGGGSLGVVNLVLTASDRTWVSSVLGSTVIVNGVHAVYVTSLIDAQTVRGVLVSPASALTLPMTGTTSWRVIDFRAAFAMVFLQHRHLA